MQQRTYFAMKFGLERRNKIREPRTQTSDAHRTDALTPGVLVIRGHGINLIQQHLWSDIATVRRKFRAALTAEHAVAHDGGGQSHAGDPGQPPDFSAFMASNRRERRT